MFGFFFVCLFKKKAYAAVDKIIILKLAVYLLEKNVSVSFVIGKSFLCPQGDLPNNALK